jgi:hypothetical protein
MQPITVGPSLLYYMAGHPTSFLVLTREHQKSLKKKSISILALRRWLLGVLAALASWHSSLGAESWSINTSRRMI